MNSLIFLALVLSAIVSTSCAFKLNSFKIKSASLNKLLVPVSTLLLPTIAMADEVNTAGSASAVLVPLGISIATIVPFLWYQQ